MLRRGIGSSTAARFEEGAQVNAETLLKVGLIPTTKHPVKILGEGELAKKLNVIAVAFSKTASEKITKAGGTATVST